MKRALFILLLLFSPFSLFAQTVDTVQFQVVVDSQPIADVQAYLELADSTRLAGQSDENGTVTFFSVPVGTDYTFEVSPSLSTFLCETCGLYDDVVFTASVTESGDGYDAQTDTLTLDDVMLEPAAIRVRVTVIDQDENPVEGVFISGWSSVNIDSYAYGETDSNGQYEFAASPGEWSINSYSDDGMYSQDFEIFDVPEEEGVTDVELEVVGSDSTITISLKNQDGTARTITEEEYASASCNDADFTNYYFTDIQAGESTVDVSVAGGENSPITYTCSVYVDNFNSPNPGGTGSTPGQTDVLSGDMDQVEITILNADFEVQVTFVDPSGDLITDFDADVYSFSDPFNGGVNHYAQTFESNAGVYSLSLIGEQSYEVGFFEQIGSDSGFGETTSTGLFITEENRYVGNTQFQSIQTTGDAPLEVSFTLTPADVTFQVTVSDAEGNGVPFAWVDLYSEEDGQVSSLNAEGPRGFFIGGVTDENGELTLYGLSGITYTANVWLPFDIGEGLINPAPQQVTPEAGIQAINFSAQQADASLVITVNAPQDINLDWAYCAAFNESSQSFADSDGGVVTLPVLTSAGAYELVCYGGAGERLYSSGFVDVDTVNVGENAITATLSDAGDFYAPTSYTFDSQSAQDITLPDACSTLNIPSGALAESGNVTVTIGTNDDPVSFGNGIQPSNLFDISAVTAGGDEISQLLKPVTLTLCYVEGDLPEGLEESELTCVASNEQGTGISATACTVDADANTVAFSVDHFSDFGLNFSESTSGSSLGSPSKVKVKRKQGCGKSAKKYKVSWSAVEDAASYQVKTTKILKGGELKTEKSKTRNVTLKGKKVNKPSTCIPLKGRNQVSVSAVSESGFVGRAEPKTINVGKKKKKKKKK